MMLKYTFLNHGLIIEIKMSGIINTIIQIVFYQVFYILILTKLTKYNFMMENTIASKLNLNFLTKIIQEAGGWE